MQYFIQQFMATTVKNSVGIASLFVNGILSIKPLANLAKNQARKMMIKRAEKMGVPWRKEVEELRQHDWSKNLAKVQNSQIKYPDYYLTSFHAYEQGNLNWDAALELEVAAKAVHATIWKDAGALGDFKLRESYHEIFKNQLPDVPSNILDVGCGVGLSSFALQEIYPKSEITGLDLSPYFLAVAHYHCELQQGKINWVHAAAESTGLPNNYFDLVSIFLVCHELPQSATRQIIQEVRRLLRPGGYLAIMDMNPKSEAFVKMPPYILTLLKSTEPYLDEYFTLNIEQTLIDVGFNTPTISLNSPRHRTIVAQLRV